jgi:hypothetical protein
MVPLAASGVKIESLWAPLADTDGAVKLTFTKGEPGRSFLGYEVTVPADASGARSLVLRHSLRLAVGDAPRLAAIVFDDAGGAWLKVSGEPAIQDTFGEVSVPVTLMVRAEFSATAASQPDWGRVRKLWVGAVFESASEGSLSFASVRFSETAYRPSRPLLVYGPDGPAWSAGADPAVKWSLDRVDDGPDGAPCTRFSFELPGGRHMYAIPVMSIGPGRLADYSGIRVTYKATLPEGIPGLLVMVGERGAQFYLDPGPPASSEWRTVDIPFAQLQLGPWSRDDNGALDLERADAIFCGLHGTAQGQLGSGTVWIARVEALP